MPKFRTLRIAKTFDHIVEAPPETVFPLLCPVREDEWVPYWQCELIYSETGYAEDNCIFITKIDETGDAIWVVSRYDAPQFRIEFVVTYPASHVEKININLLRNAGNSTRVCWQRIYTALTEFGTEQITRLTGKPFDEKMLLVSKALNHFCLTGEMIEVDSH